MLIHGLSVEAELRFYGRLEYIVTESAQHFEDSRWSELERAH